MFNHSLQSVTTVEVFDKNGRLRQSFINGKEPIYHDNWVELTVIDENGNRQETKRAPFKSFVNNFGYVLAYNLYGTANTTTCKTTANVAASVSVACPDVLAAATADTYGIQVGTNTTASGYNTSIFDFVRAEDYSLRLKIAHGTSTGQLSYGATTQDTYGNGNSTLAYTRSFTNNTAASITVKEVGLVGKANTTEYFLLARDADDASQETSGPNYITTVVGAGQILEVKYILTTMALNLYFPTGRSASGITIPAPDTLTANLMGIMASCMGTSGSATRDVTIVTGASATVDFNANAAYKLTTPIAGVETSGILVGKDPNAGVTNPSILNYKLVAQNTDLDHSAHTVVTPYAIDLVTNRFSVNIGMSGSTAVASDKIGLNDISSGLVIGSTRDFTNSTASAIELSECGLFCAGTGTSATILIQRSTFPLVTLTNAESIRIGIYVVLPARLEKA